MSTSPFSQLSLFASLHKQELYDLTETLQQKEVSAGTVLFREGDRGEGLYIVQEGEIEIVYGHDTPGEQVLAVLGPGEFFGEMSLLTTERQRTATARAKSHAYLWEMHHDDFVALVTRHPASGLEMMRELSERLFTTQSNMIRDLRERNRQLTRVCEELRIAREQLLEKERLEQELKVARRIQQALLPRETPALQGWEIATHYQPARAVGGDFYAFRRTPDGRLFFVIGDVTDKGVPAALGMATTRSVIRAILHGTTSPAIVLTQANEMVSADIPAGMFVTCLCAILDPDSGLLRYANAGHGLPYRRGTSGVTELRATGLPLGIMPTTQYEEKMVQLERGDSVILCSDGLIEAHSPTGEMFGFPRTRQLLAHHPATSATSVMAFLLEELTAFTGEGWEQEDDISLLVLRWGA